MNRTTMTVFAIGLGLCAGVASAVPEQWTVESGGNGHWYEMSTYRLDWNQARADAASRTHMGLPGYLATLTSAGEAAFIGEFRAPGGYGSGWLSGSDAAVEGDWRWTDGPEAGRLFWRGGPGGTPFGYASWGTGWPNESDYLATNYGSWGSYGVAQAEFFYIEYSAPVPEPAAWLLMSAGLLAIARRSAVRSRPTTGDAT